MCGRKIVGSHTAKVDNANATPYLSYHLCVLYASFVQRGVSPEEREAGGKKKLASTQLHILEPKWQQVQDVSVTYASLHFHLKPEVTIWNFKTKFRVSNFKAS